MSDPFVAEIRIFGFNFAPTGWASCDGQLMPISQNTALFSLLGTSYGGDGRSTFGLPDLQGSAPVSQGQSPGLSEYFVGEQTGTTSVTLLQTEIPSHSHALNISTAPALERQPPGQLLAVASGVGPYGPSSGPTATMSPSIMAPAGGSLPHNNLQPYLTLKFCIALQGIFPARS